MGRRSDLLTDNAKSDASDTGVIQVVSRAFDVLRCFESHNARLGNRDVATRCGLPPSTVSRLTLTLTRLGHLVYLPQDQKYRLGPSAVAMSTSMVKGLHFRDLLKTRMQEFAEKLPGTIGFVLPDRFHLVYLEYARTYNAIGLHSSTGTRIAMARTAAGHAYVAALAPEKCDALLAEMDREVPADAQALREYLDGDRASLRKNGYVTSCGLWHPLINGCSVPLWSRHYQTYVVVTIGLLASMYDEARLHSEVAPLMLELAHDISEIPDGLEVEPIRFDPLAGSE